MAVGKGTYGCIPSGLRVMIIDEDPACLLYLTTMLQVCNFLVESFNNAVEALYTLWMRRGDFDLVIADCHTISMDGFKLIDYIVTNIGIQVISTSADDDPDFLNQAFLSGACVYLPKPITLADMEVVWQNGWRNKSTISVELPGVRKTAVASSKGKCVSNDEGPMQKKEEESSISEGIKMPVVQWDSMLHRRFHQAVQLISDLPKNEGYLMEVEDEVEDVTSEQIGGHLMGNIGSLANDTNAVNKTQMEEPSSSAAFGLESANNTDAAGLSSLLEFILDIDFKIEDFPLRNYLLNHEYTNDMEGMQSGQPTVDEAYPTAVRLKVVVSSQQGILIDADAGT